jgi:hypothetical protein
VTPNTNGQNTEGGFFGWVGRSLGGAWNVLSGTFGGFVNGVLGPVLNFGNGLLNAFIAALIQALTLLAKGIQIFLNVIGQFFHLGNVGDNLIAFFTGLANLLINFVGTAIGYFITTTNALVAFALIASSFVTNFMGNLITFITNTVLTLFNLIWTVVSIFFRYSVTPSFILMLDWLMGMVSVWVNGVRGWIRWINFNIMAFTKVFWAIYRLLNEAVKAILNVVGTIRGSGTGTGTGT